VSKNQPFRQIWNF